MKKFTSTFPNTNIQSLKRVWPEYSSLFDKIDSLDDLVKEGVSKQVEIEYYDLMQTLDGFLFEPENLKKYNQSHWENPLNLDLLEKDTIFDEEEAKEILETEISDLMKEVDEDLLKSQIASDKIKIKEEEDIKIEDVKKSDLSPDQHFEGVSLNYRTLNRNDFERALAMFKRGCEFYVGEYLTKTFVLFKVSETQRIVIETPFKYKSYKSITNEIVKDLQVFMLGRSYEDLDLLLKVFKPGFDLDEDSLRKVDDSVLYNSPVLYTSWLEGTLYEKADFLDQPQNVVTLDNYISTYFNTYFPLEQILTLVYIKNVWDNTSYTDEINQVKEKIQNTLTNETMNLEGVGPITHTPQVLEILQKKSLIQNNYKLSSLGETILKFLGRSSSDRALQPSFRPFMYYKVNLEENMKKSKEVFSSSYNGYTIYHTKKSIIDIDYGLTLSTQQLKDFDLKNVKNNPTFPEKWQTIQNFGSYQEYLPFASEGDIEMKIRGVSALKGKAKLNFQDYEKFTMWCACVANPFMIWALNSAHYNYIKQLYSDRTIKIMGPQKLSSTEDKNVFFHIVDEKDKLLAILRPQGTKVKKTTEIDSSLSDIEYEIFVINGQLQQSTHTVNKITQSKREELEERLEELREKSVELKNQELQKGLQGELQFYTNWKSFTASRVPSPVWNMKSLVDKLQEENGSLLSNGVYISQANAVGEYKEEDLKPIKEEKEETEDRVIRVGEPIDTEVLEDAVKEENTELEGLQDELKTLEEFLVDSGGTDEELKQEIEDKRKEIELLKNK